MAADLQKEKVILESDCHEAIDLIQRKWSPSCRCANLVRMCQEALERKPLFRTCHITRDANVSADHLAKLSYNQENGLLTHQEPPRSISHLLSLDMYEHLPNGP